MPHRAVDEAVAELMISILSESLIRAHTALGYLTADLRFTEMGAWRQVYQEHLAQLYAQRVQLRVRTDMAAVSAQSYESLKRLPFLSQCSYAHMCEQAHGKEGSKEGATAVLPTYSASKTAEGASGRLVVPRLLVVVADDALNVDLASLRAAARTGGFEWQRLMSPTRGELARELSRARQYGRPYTWLHLGAHGGPEGVELADGVADGVWLSAQLRDVDVLLLAACSSSAMADQLGIVPWVISFAEAIETYDTALFAGAFWLAMGRHRRAEDALDEALDVVSLEVAEFVRRHW